MYGLDSVSDPVVLEYYEASANKAIFALYLAYILMDSILNNL